MASYDRHLARKKHAKAAESAVASLLEPWNHWLFGILQRGDSETIHPKYVGDKERLFPFFG
jgi:hypothetical protein